MIFWLVFLLFVNLSAKVDEVSELIKQHYDKYDEALSLIKKAYEIFTELKNDLFVNSKDFDRAFQYFELKQYEKCIRIFISLIRKNECKLESMYFLGESYLAQKKIDKACVYYNTILTSRHEYINEKVIIILKNSYLGLIKCFFILGRNKDAYKTIENFIKRFPNEIENHELKFICQDNDCMNLLSIDCNDRNLEHSENSEDLESLDNNCVVKI